MNNKQITITLIVIMIVAVIAYAITSLRSKPTSPELKTGPSSTQALPPVFPPAPQDAPEFNYDISKVAAKPTPKIYQYTITSSFSTSSKAGAIASFLGLKGQPQTTTGSRGTYVSWSSGLAGLLVGPDMSRFTYSAPHPKTLPTLKDYDRTFMTLAEDMMKKITPDATLSSPVPTYYSASSDHLTYGQRESANAIQIVYQVTLDGLPLISGYPKESEVVIRFGSDKVLYYLSSPLFPPITKTANEMSVISLETATQQLIADKGTLVHVYSQSDINEPDTKQYDFSVSQISRTDLALYLDYKKNTLLPVYVFYGKATDERTQKVVDTITLLSAGL